MPVRVQSMSSRLEATSAVLGEYMLKGWTLTDLACDRCHTTPLMRQPAAEAQREGHAPIQFCASCDGGPTSTSTADRRPSASASESSASVYETPEEFPPSSDTPPSPSPSAPSTIRASPPSTPRRAPLRRTPPTSPPSSHAASARGDPDAAADAISALLLRGYSLLSSTCPEPTCRGIPLVGFPRRKDGTRDPRRECVSCGKRWVDEKDLAASGLKPQTASVGSTSTTTPSASVMGTPRAVRTSGTAAAAAAAVAARPSTPPDEPESPRTRARRELYAQGNAIMQERADAAAMKKAEEEALKAAGLDARGMPVPQVAAPAPVSHSLLQPKQAGAGSSTKSVAKGKGRAVPSIRAKPFATEDHLPAAPDGKLRVVLVSSGSVASIKIPNILEALGGDDNVEVQVVATQSSLHFYDREALEAKHEGVGIWSDADEWSDWKKIGDPILHIELRRWADLIVVVPTSADMLAKIAGGICDNLALSMLRALEDTPVILCPAMNTFMYSHPLTARHLDFIKEVLGYHILGPQGANSGRKLACGDIGAGKMTEWTDIVSIIRGYAALTRTRARSKKSMNATLRTLIADVEGEDEDGEGFFTPKQAMPTSLTKGSDTPQSTTTELQEVASHALVGVKSAVHWPVVKLHAALTTVFAGVNGLLLMPTLHVLALLLSAAHKALATPLAVLHFLLSPLLVLLHVAFTLSSIVLRVFETRTTTRRDITKPPPKHVALILVPDNEGGESAQVIAERFVESVRRAILWSAEWGVADLSVWDRDGLGVRFHTAVTHSLLNLPPSPPSSSPSPRTGSDSEDAGGADTPLTVGDDTISSSVYVNSPTGPRRVEVHFLAPSASDTIARVTRRLADSGVAPSDVQQADLDRAIKADLHLPSDPDLVIIHHLSVPGFFRGLLPRPAPELHGFPAWLLRITEIYAHPPRLPLQVPFVGRLLHNSHLPILRKFGASFPSSLDVGVLDPDEWEGAQMAWEAVDQRRGK